MRSVRSAVAIVATALITSCGAAAGGRVPGTIPGSGPGTSPATTPPTASGLPASPGLPLRTPPTSAPRTLVVGDQDNGHAVSLRAGERLLLVLTGTYWRVDGSSNPGVLRPAALPTVSPQIGGCPPGEGCGTVTALFDAVAAGQADVSAARTSCGEAMSCTGNLGIYRVTVLVAD